MVEKTRTLGFTVAYAIGLGTMIAAGIFSLSGTAVAEIGSSAVIAFVIAAIVASITAAAYSEFASIYSESGGGYLFASRTLKSDYIVYTEGVMLFLGYSATTAFYLATMGEWVHEFVFPAPPWLVGAATAVLLGVLNARGTEESGAFQVIVTGAKVAVLFAFIGGAAAYKPVDASVATFTGAVSTDLPGIVQIAALAFITFFGFSAIAASAGEIIKPRKTVPRAIAASIVTVTILYALVIVAMVNSPIPAEVVAQEGETAMGKVANAFLGPIGMQLIVAGAIFSMVSASNASILAASRIGYLMGREGRALRRFHLIDRQYGTPIWAIAACTFTIVTLIVTFIGIFHGSGAPFGIDLGLAGLTGFANLNLLIPLSVVNVALIVSRRRYPDQERPFRVPLSPVLPVIGILANLALIVSLPIDGVLAGVFGIIAFLGIYYVWGGALPVEQVMSAITEGEGPQEEGDVTQPSGTGDFAEVYRILVPIAREEDVVDHVLLADAIGQALDDEVEIEVLYVEDVPEQVPSDAVSSAGAQGRINELESAMADVEVDADLTFEGYVSQDIAFTILEVARDTVSDLILMGYPERHRDVVQTVQHRAPCDVLYVYGVESPLDLSVINVGAGGGPNHRALLPLVDALGENGAEVHVIRVQPEIGGTPEQIQETIDGLRHTETVEIHNVEEKNVAKGLVETAKDNGGVLFIGASRDLLLKQWLFGSTPDHAVDIAEAAEVPVLIFRARTGVKATVEDAAFLVYRFLRVFIPGR